LSNIARTADKILADGKFDGQSFDSTPFSNGSVIDLSFVVAEAISARPDRQPPTR